MWRQRAHQSLIVIVKLLKFGKGTVKFFLCSECADTHEEVLCIPSED